ncbi:MULTISPECIES: conjugative transposon protein TraN [Chryseobacterium]|uniref:conjugative transposon protein TraN n=1 Tax=Chryseobacterium TaxID=59732 RepID=UPI00192D547C|nr:MULTISPECIES: conjugative transposon protein TraN [Chryseobacterium]MCD9616097.1 conjugative transposon protein TraN [Chryseobacterium gleum]QRA41342.1 conjugative transposon protein TraN [Chryseobacterium cucumeris]
MRIILHIKLLSIILLLLINIVKAQSRAEDGSLHKTRLNSYKMQVTYDKTTHLLFPSSIRYVDLGSDYLTAGKAEDLGNVLRIKAAVKDFETETNFSVITKDGRFYSFDVVYDPYPDILSYDLSKLYMNTEKENGPEVLFEELKGDSPSLTDHIMKTLQKSTKRSTRHIHAKNDGVYFSLKSLNTFRGKFYFVLQIKNSRNINYDIDFIHFKITDKKNLKRTAVQEKVVYPVRIYSPVTSVKSHSTAESVYLFDQFTLLKDQVLSIEIFEKNGGRHQRIKVKNKDLVRAKIIKYTPDNTI